MRVLAVTQPGAGHFYPMIPTLRCLVEAGHDVHVVSAPRFVARIEETGFEAVGAGLDFLESEVRTSFPQTRGLAPQELGIWYLNELFADLTVHAMVPDLLALAEEHQPDLLLRNDYEFATCIVSERIGIPHATIGCAFIESGQPMHRHISEPLAFARSAWGLAPYPTLSMLDPHLYLTQAPLEWHDHVPTTARAIRPDGVTRSGANPLLDMADYRPDRPTVYASFGTVHNTTDALFPTLLEGLSDEPLNLVITVGRNLDPTTWGAPPSNVIIRRFIPQDLLLPHCDLFINNGSFFTIIGALLNAVPVLLCPLCGDQPAGSARFTGLGFGRMLRQPGRPVPPLTDDIPVFSPLTVRDSCRRILRDASCAQRVREGRDALRELPPPSIAVEWLEALAGASR